MRCRIRTGNQNNLAQESEALQERRRAEFHTALADPSADVLNAKLRGVFGRVLPDHGEGYAYFVWLDGCEIAASLVFGWPTGDASEYPTCTPRDDGAQD
jgi:hypothetical protein